MKKPNANLTCGLVAAVIISAIVGITVCVKCVINPNFFE